MRVKVQLATPYKLPEVVGGISTYVESLRYALLQAGMEVTVGREIDASSDIIHCHAHWYVLRDALKAGAASGFTFHTLPELSFMKRKAFKKLLAKSKFLIHLSEYSRRRINSTMGLDGSLIRPSVRPQPVPAEIVENLKRRLGLQSRYPILCMISPLEHHDKCEGIKLLMKSLGLIESRGDPILLIIGSGSQLNELQCVAEKENVKSRVSFLGRVSDVWPYLHLCDVYAHISLMDNAPLAILEAMSIGKPVISVDVGGIGELLGSEGILTGASSSDIAETVSSLSEDRSTMKRVSNGLRSRFQDIFSLERMAQEHIGLYREVLA
jgi:glycosyltransferase involved in cell wall biosynthesis